MKTPTKASASWPQGLAIRSMMHALDFLPHGHFIVEFVDDTQIEFDNFGQLSAFIMQRERDLSQQAAEMRGRLKPTLENMSAVAYSLRIVPEGEIVPIQILEVIRDYFNAISALK